MAATGPPPAGLHFLVSTGVEKPDPELRKFIRSHVMLGKNRGKTRSTGKKFQRPIADARFANPDTSPVDGMDIPDADEALGQSSVPSTVASTATSQPILPLTIPRKFGWNLAPIRFADAVEPGTVEVFLQFSSIAKQILFPLEPCVFFERKAETWIAPLTFDPAFLHAMIFTSRSYFNGVAAGRASAFTEVTLHHFLKALKLLRERMSHEDDPATLADTTAAAIMALTCHALLTDDYMSARNHVEGLHKMVLLRGGVTSFQSNAKLLLEILRCDIGMALHRGSRPVFFNDASSEPFPPYPDLTSLLDLRIPLATSPLGNMAAFSEGLDGGLSDSWNVMSRFCSLANFAVASKQLISVDTYLDTMAAVMYRLVRIRFKTGSSSEAIRLGLLAFSCSIFLQWRTLGLSYSHLTSELRDCLVRFAWPRSSSRLLLWLLMVGAVSVFDTVDDPWLEPSLMANLSYENIDSWHKMQDLLHSFMWIGLVNDKVARRVFDSTMERMKNTHVDHQAAPSSPALDKLLP